jgi:hypothetical protein
VNDLTAACNPFLEHLLYQNQHILGGLIRGIYPHGSLVLDPTNADMWSFPTLDIRSISTPRMCVDKTTGLAYRYVHSHSVLYDKRREKCYDGIPIAQYTHVSSTVSENVDRSIIMGQLHCFRELIQDRQAFIQVCALQVFKLVSAGHPERKMLAKFKFFLKLYPDMFGENTHT